MKLIYVTVTFPYDENETFLAPEVKELLRIGHDVCIIPRSPRGRLVHREFASLVERTIAHRLFSFEMFREALVQIGRNPAKVLGALGLIRRSRSLSILSKNLAVFPKALWMAGVARRKGIEHIHAHWASTSATMAMVASHISGIPWSFTGHRWDIPEDNLLVIKAGHAAFARYICESSLRNARDLGAVPPGNDSSVVHMGVELPIKSPRRADGLPSRPFVVVCPARLVEVKGHRYLIEAASLLKGRNVAVSMRLAGIGGLEGELKALAGRSGVEADVHFLGIVPHEVLMDGYRNGDVDAVVLPSLDLPGGERSEGIPVSLIEAMSFGIPVISTETGGIPELLHGGAGLMVPPADATSLAAAIEALVLAPDDRARIGRAGMQRVEQDFDIEVIAAKLSGKFRSAADRAGPFETRPLDRVSAAGSP